MCILYRSEWILRFKFSRLARTMQSYSGNSLLKQQCVVCMSVCMSVHLLFLCPIFLLTLVQTAAAAYTQTNSPAGSTQCARTAYVSAHCTTIDTLVLHCSNTVGCSFSLVAMVGHRPVQHSCRKRETAWSALVWQVSNWCCGVQREREREREREIYLPQA